MSFSIKFKQRVVQTLSFLALNSNFRNAEMFGICLPVMNCNACPISWTLCPIYRISELVQFHESLFSTEWLVIAAMFGFCVLVGRFFCGWICPAGFVQDLLYKIPFPRITLPSYAKWFKYAFLIITVFGVAYFAGKEVPAFFCTWCPTATVETIIPAMITSPEYSLGAAGHWRFLVLAIVILLALANHRSFCKLMCPIGALVALTNKFSFLSLRLHTDKCIHCGKCDKTCPMDVPVETCSAGTRPINRNTECIECLNCESVCPTSAITNNSRLVRK